MLLFKADKFAFVSSGCLVLLELISREQSYIAMAFGRGLITEIAPFQQTFSLLDPVVNRIGFNGSFITSPTAVDGVHFS
jgi:hypothetical protein